ncbi:DUF4352 domain-containing protein [Streptococcus suis]|nr:DUF4352 domain-containing protein [Streptococcus suis]
MHVYIYNGSVNNFLEDFMKKLTLISVAVMSIFSLVGCASSSSTSSSQDTSTTTQTTTEASASSSEKSEEVTYRLVGDVLYIVHSKEVTTNVGGEFGKTANGVFLVLRVTVKNNGKEAITVTDDFFTLLKGDVEYKSDSTAGIYANQDAKFFLTEVNPENSVTGNVVFDITEEIANDPSIQLRVQTGFWGTETGVINLNNV